MKINIAEQLLPEVYNRHGKDCYLDPIRQKLIYITPEETVRQRMISYLVNELKVPKGAILVEEHLSHYNVPSKKRADIVVHGKKDETQYPVLIVECKAPDVFLDEKAHQQVFDYCDLINADYAIVCNGNAGGGYFGGPYRSFLIEYKGNIEFISFAFSTYARTEKPGIVKTCLNIAHDDEKETHHALPLSFDDNIQVIGDKVTIYHSGRIAIGNKGSGKIDELRQFVAERYPKIIDGKRFNLGSLKNDYQWNIDQPDVTEVIVNLISYALIRDEYRDYIKQQ